MAAARERARQALGRRADLHPPLHGRPRGGRCHPDAIVVDESITASIDLGRTLSFRTPGDYFGAGRGHRPSPARRARREARAPAAGPSWPISGDGSAMYSMQALWTAAHHDLGRRLPCPRQPRVPHPQARSGRLSPALRRPRVGAPLRPHGPREARSVVRGHRPRPGRALPRASRNPATWLRPSPPRSPPAGRAGRGGGGPPVTARAAWSGENEEGTGLRPSNDHRHSPTSARRWGGDLCGPARSRPDEQRPAPCPSPLSWRKMLRGPRWPVAEARGAAPGHRGAVRAVCSLLNRQLAMVALSHRPGRRHAAAHGGAHTLGRCSRNAKRGRPPGVVRNFYRFARRKHSKSGVALEESNL